MFLARLFSRPAVTCGDHQCRQTQQGIPRSIRSIRPLRGAFLLPARPLPYRGVCVVCQAKKKPKQSKKKKTKAKIKKAPDEPTSEETEEVEALKDTLKKSSLMKLTKADLIDELTERNIETFGKKTDLVDRLYNDLLGIEDTKDPLSGVPYSALMAKPKKFLQEACDKRGIKKRKTKEEMATALLEFFEKQVETSDETPIKASAPQVTEKSTKKELLAFTVVELRAVCDELGLPCAGKKSDLVDRILASFKPQEVDFDFIHRTVSERGALKPMKKKELLDLFKPSGLNLEGLTKAKILDKIDLAFEEAVEVKKKKDEKEEEKKAEEKDMQEFVQSIDPALEARIIDEDEDVDEIIEDILQPGEFIETQKPPEGKALLGNVDQIVDDLVTEVHRVYGQYLITDDAEEELESEPSYVIDDDDDEMWEDLNDADVITDVDVRERMAKKRSIPRDYRDPTPEELAELEKSEAALDDIDFDEEVDQEDHKEGGDEFVGKRFKEVPMQDEEELDAGGFGTQSRKDLIQGSSKDEEADGDDDDDDVISTGRRRRSRKRRRGSAPVAEVDFDSMQDSTERTKEPDEEQLNKPIDTSFLMGEDDDEEEVPSTSSLLTDDLDDTLRSQRGPTFPPDVELFEESGEKEKRDAVSSAEIGPQPDNAKGGVDFDVEELDFGDEEDESKSGNVMELDDELKGFAPATEIEVEAVAVEEETAELDEGQFPEAESEPTRKGETSLESADEIKGDATDPKIAAETKEEKKPEAVEEAKTDVKDSKAATREKKKMVVAESKVNIEDSQVERKEEEKSVVAETKSDVKDSKAETKEKEAMVIVESKVDMEDSQADTEEEKESVAAETKADVEESKAETKEEKKSVVVESGADKEGSQADTEDMEKPAVVEIKADKDSKAELDEEEKPVEDSQADTEEEKKLVAAETKADVEESKAEIKKEKKPEVVESGDEMGEDEKTASAVEVEEKAAPESIKTGAESDSPETGVASEDKTSEESIPSIAASEEKEETPSEELSETVTEATTSPKKWKLIVEESTEEKDDVVVAESNEAKDTPITSEDDTPVSSPKEVPTIPESTDKKEIHRPEVVSEKAGTVGEESGEVGTLDEDSAEVSGSLPAVLKADSSKSTSKDGNGDVTTAGETSRGEGEDLTVVEIQQKVEDQKAALRVVREETKKRKKAIADMKARVEASDAKTKLNLAQMQRLLEVTESIKAQRYSWQRSMEKKMETLKADVEKAQQNKKQKEELESSIKELEGEFQTLQNQVQERDKQADELRESINRGDKKGEQGSSPKPESSGRRKIEEVSPIITVAALGLSFFEAASKAVNLFIQGNKEKGKEEGDRK